MAKSLIRQRKTPRLKSAAPLPPIRTPQPARTADEYSAEMGQALNPAQACLVVRVDEATALYLNAHGLWFVVGPSQMGPAFERVELLTYPDGLSDWAMRHGVGEQVWAHMFLVAQYRNNYAAAAIASGLCEQLLRRLGR